MLEVVTKFGKIYIEELYNREENDRIKIFDSNKDYLDYYSMETINYIAERRNITMEEVLQIEIEKIRQCDDIECLIMMLVSEWEMYSKEWANVAKLLEIDSLTEVSNDYVNKIGDYYIVIME